MYFSRLIFSYNGLVIIGIFKYGEFLILFLKLLLTQNTHSNGEKLVKKLVYAKVDHLIPIGLIFVDIIVKVIC